jgi:nucleotide-binding universal stress UspA family protein
MMTDSGKKTVRRIAVALDASEQSRRLLDLASGIAAALEAELEGVFVEDADLIRLAGLPFLREFRLSTLGEDSIDAERLQREMRATARRVKETLERSAGRIGCAWSFRVWRGDVEAEILSAALDAEMFTLSPIGRFAPFNPRPRARPPRQAGLVVSVLFDGSDGAARALAAAAELADRHRARLSVILQGADDPAIEGQRRKAADLLGDAVGKTGFVPLPGADARALAGTLQRTGSDLLLLDSANALLDRRTLWQSLGALDCPVLIIR